MYINDRAKTPYVIKGAVTSMSTVLTDQNSVIFGLSLCTLTTLYLHFIMSEQLSPTIICLHPQQPTTTKHTLRFYLISHLTRSVVFHRWTCNFLWWRVGYCWRWLTQYHQRFLENNAVLSFLNVTIVIYGWICIKIGGKNKYVYCVHTQLSISPVFGDASSSVSAYKE